MLFNQEQFGNEVPFEENQFNETPLMGEQAFDERNMCHQGMYPHHMHQGQGQGCMQPIVEPVKVCYVQRNFEHMVPHICPVHTRIINNHIYRHTFTPNYTCSEENRVQHAYCGSCNQFGCC